MSEREIREILRSVCEDLDLRALRLVQKGVRKVVLPTVVGATLALTACDSATPQGQVAETEQHETVSDGAGVDDPDPGVDPGPVPPYMAPDDADAVEPPEPAYMAPDIWDAQILYMAPDAMDADAPQPLYMGPDIVQPPYMAPDPDVELPQPLYMGPDADLVDPGPDPETWIPEILPPYMAPDMGPQPLYMAPDDVLAAEVAEDDDIVPPIQPLYFAPNCPDPPDVSGGSSGS